MDQIICEAIKDKQIITFEYHNGTRTVEPFLLGISTAGNKVLSAFQLKNTIKLSEQPDWKLFYYSDIKRIQLTEKYFSGYRQDYNSQDSRMVKYICEVNRF